MNDKRDDKSNRPKARLPRGFRDRAAAEIAAERAMLDTIRGVYESYGFDALETPAFEYTDALGKFLPDVDRPNEGVFSLKDDDEQWMSLRYDLTAPLARYVAENFQNLPKPFRRYQVGTVWRNEKPGPGRFREFVQFDADTVGSASPAADVELMMMIGSAMTALGLSETDYVIKMNSRKLLDAMLLAVGISTDDRERRGIVLRALDKRDRLGEAGVRALLGQGRKDESGDFTRGANLSVQQADALALFCSPNVSLDQLNHIRDTHDLEKLDSWKIASDEINQIDALINQTGFDPSSRILLDTSVIRGLDYYTGFIFEAQLAFPIANESGEVVVFGSVAGGGRYDDLVARFTGQRLPATGVSIGISRLLTALRARNLASKGGSNDLLIVVLVMDRDATAEALKLANELRTCGFRAEAYAGESGMKAQLKYCDKRNAAFAIIEGADERARGEVTIKDLALGAELAKGVESRAAWVGERPAQQSVARAKLAETLRAMTAASRH